MANIVELEPIIAVEHPDRASVKMRRRRTLGYTDAEATAVWEVIEGSRDADAPAARASTRRNGRHETARYGVPDNARSMPEPVMPRLSAPQAAPQGDPAPAESREHGITLARETSVDPSIVVRETRVVQVANAALPQSLDERLVVMEHPASPAAAAFRALWRRIRHQSNARNIFVTAPHSGDGSSTCAVNLAAAAAEQRPGSVVLVEANLDKPIYAKLLGLDARDGLSEQLAEHFAHDSSWRVYEVDAPRFHVLPAAQRQSTAPTLEAASMEALLSELSSVYETVIVDAPSVLGSADLGLIVDAAEAIVIAARAGHTRKRDIEKALRELSPAPVLGAALLGAKE